MNANSWWWGFGTLPTTTQTSRVKYPGIVADAAALGTTRQHLWEVLQGNRVSKRLMHRYTALKGGKL